MNVLSCIFDRASEIASQRFLLPTCALKKLNLHSDLFYIGSCPLNKLPKCMNGALEHIYK